MNNFKFILFILLVPITALVCLVALLGHLINRDLDITEKYFELIL